MHGKAVPHSFTFQIKVGAATLLFAVIGTAMVIEGYQSLAPSNAEFTHGKVLRKEETSLLWRTRPLVTIRISGTETDVKAILNVGTVENVPNEISFYYSGDPSAQLVLPYEPERIYLGLGFLAVSLFCVIVLFWDRIRGR